MWVYTSSEHNAVITAITSPLWNLIVLVFKFFPYSIKIIIAYSYFDVLILLINLKFISIRRHYKSNHLWFLADKTISTMQSADFKYFHNSPHSHNIDNFPLSTTTMWKVKTKNHINTIFFSEATLSILMSVRPYVCLSVCPSG